MPAKLSGAEALDAALAAVEADATDKNVALAAAQLVLATARPAARSTRVRATGRAKASGRRGTVVFGSAGTPWTAPSHFGHGTAGRPRAQGGWITGNMFLFAASDKRREDVFDLYARRTVDAIRANGLA